MGNATRAYCYQVRPFFPLWMKKCPTIEMRAMVPKIPHPPLLPKAIRKIAKAAPRKARTAAI